MFSKLSTASASFLTRPRVMAKLYTSQYMRFSSMPVLSTPKEIKLNFNLTVEDI